VAAARRPRTRGLSARDVKASRGAPVISFVVALRQRRRVDWPIILGPKLPVPTVVGGAGAGKLASLLSAFDEILVLEDPDAILRRAVELARHRIGLARAGIFLFDVSHDVMLGTWGTDLQGAVVDERHIMYDVSDTDREALRRAEEEAAHFTVFDNCPIVEHRPGETRVVGRGWVACTPIRSARARIGILFNDGGLTGEPIDEAKQVHAAILCSLLGTMLDPVRGRHGRAAVSSGGSTGQRLAAATVAILAKDPSIGGKEMATRLDISLSRLARVFKAEMGMSLVEYRNRLRLDRFTVLVDRGGSNLLDAALTAGFGSYAQFHRVFRALRHITPREYLQRRVPAPRHK
jgi:AraC-like DNA-binding protein